MKGKEAQIAEENVGTELGLMYALKRYVIAKNSNKWFEDMFPYDASMLQLLDAARRTYYNTLKPWPDTKITKVRTEEDIT